MQQTRITRKSIKKNKEITKKNQEDKGDTEKRRVEKGRKRIEIMETKRRKTKTI